MILTSSIVERGVSSAGLITQVQPAASAADTLKDIFLRDKFLFF